MSPTSQGLAPREGLECLLVKICRTGPLVEPRRGPQAGKSGDPRAQNTDSSPQAQGVLGLGLAPKPKGKCGAPRAPTACGLHRREAIDWAWASPLPHAASATARLTKRLVRATLAFIAFLRLAPDPLSRSLLPKSPDLLQSTSELPTNGALKGKGRFAACLV